MLHQKVNSIGDATIGRFDACISGRTAGAVSLVSAVVVAFGIVVATAGAAVVAAGAAVVAAGAAVVAAGAAVVAAGAAVVVAAGAPPHPATVSNKNMANKNDMTLWNELNLFIRIPPHCFLPNCL